MINFTKIGKNSYAFNILGAILDIRPEDKDISTAEVVKYDVSMVRVKFLDDYKIEDLQHIPVDSDHYRNALQLLGM